MNSIEQLQESVRLAIVKRYRGHQLRTLLNSKGLGVLSFDFTFDNGTVGDVIISNTVYFLFQITVSRHKGYNAPTKTFFLQPRELGLVQNPSTNIVAHCQAHRQFFTT